MVRYLFCTIGDLTYQSPLVDKRASEKFIAALLSVMLLEMIDLYLHVCVCVCVCQVQVLWKVCMLQI